MIRVDAVLDAFINANILFVVAFGLWALTRYVLEKAGLRHAYDLQLKLLNGVFLGVVISPFVVLAVGTLHQNGIARSVNVNLSDLVVAHYLNGGLNMQATDFERLLSMRDTFTSNLANAAGWVAWGVIAAFVAGLFVGAIRLVFSLFCLRQIVSSSHTWRKFGRIRLKVSDRTLVPFSTRGIRNYYVVLPSTMLVQPEALKVSLAHEFQHIRQGDLEWEIILETMKPFFFLNPAFHAWKRQVEDLRELTCDAKVLNSGRVEIRSYCETLLSVCQNALRRDRKFVIAVPKVTLVTADRSSLRQPKKSFLELRLDTLIHARKLRHPAVVYNATLLPLVAAVILTALAIQKPADWSQDRLTLSTVVNLERLDKINQLAMFGKLRN